MLLVANTGREVRSHRNVTLLPPPPPNCTTMLRNFNNNMPLFCYTVKYFFYIPKILVVWLHQSIQHWLIGLSVFIHLKPWQWLCQIKIQFNLDATVMKGKKSWSHSICLQALGNLGSNQAPSEDITENAVVSYWITKHYHLKPSSFMQQEWRVIIYAKLRG
jgi:hypothetical protein